MKQINEYINENINHNIIEEGKIWDSIKEFFKKIFKSDDNYYLFKPSKKKYDRFKDDGEYIVKHNNEFKKYIENNFKFSYVSLSTKRVSKMQEILNVHDRLNFEVNQNHKYYVGYFIDIQTKDICFVVDGYKKEDSEDYFLVNFYIVDEYSKYITNKDIVDLLLNQKKECKFNDVELQKLFIKEKDNKELYKTLIKNCNFKKDSNSSEHLAYIKRENKQEENK